MTLRSGHQQIQGLPRVLARAHAFPGLSYYILILIITLFPKPRRQPGKAIPPCCSSHEKPTSRILARFSCCHRSALGRLSSPEFHGFPDHHRHPRTKYITSLSRPEIHLHPPRSPSPYRVIAPRTRVPPHEASPSPPVLRAPANRKEASHRGPCLPHWPHRARPGAKGRPSRARRLFQPTLEPGEPLGAGTITEPANHPHQCHHETHRRKINSGPASVHVPSTGRPRIIIRLHSPFPRRKQSPHARALPSQGTPHDSLVLANSPKTIEAFCPFLPFVFNPEATTYRHTATLIGVN